jgi:hypothetical protein
VNKLENKTTQEKLNLYCPAAVCLFFSGKNRELYQPWSLLTLLLRHRQTVENERVVLRFLSLTHKYIKALVIIVYMA